ncbi:sensor histidine kinase [Salinibius halmophilus]|uniref:sensor histidine kinase n=1 Tax=Salinibius halmophilus TaxID=1853216 RepID=UPI000E675D54|nr:ATP-binding protein [Salinibius halmophilus]
MLRNWYSRLAIRHKVTVLTGTVLGLMLLLHASMIALSGTATQLQWWLFGIAATLAVLSIFLVWRVIKVTVNRPVTHLSRIARLVGEHDSHNARAQPMYDDEVGQLVRSFNQMLDQISSRETALEQQKLIAEQSILAVRQSNELLEQENRVRIEVEQRLTEVQTDLDAMIRYMPSIMIGLDDHQVVTWWNNEAKRITGVPAAKAVGSRLANSFNLPVKAFAAIEEALHQLEVTHFDNVEYSIDGHDYILNLMIYPVDRGGRTGVVLRVDDITERHKMSEVMIQTEKMMSVGGLAAGMAHEINNPLSAITQGAQNIRRRLSTELPKNKAVAEQLNFDLERMQQYLHQREILNFLNLIQQSSQRASNIVTNMLQFARRSDASLVEVSVYSVIEQSLKLLESDKDLTQAQSNNDIKIRFEVAQADIYAPVVAVELEQVLVNILRNAHYAVRKSSRFEQHDGCINIRLWQTERHVHIDISDNGIGMSDAVRRRVFEPFYTTKSVGEGSGLGLSVSYFIITNHHHGTMTVSSEPEVGTTFSIKLPKAERIN